MLLKPTDPGVTLFSLLPSLSILQNGQWENAPNQTVPTAPNVAHIFDPLAINGSDQFPSFGFIPLYPDNPQYSQKRYWQLQNVNLGGILSAVILHGVLTPCGPYTNDELKMVKVLFSLLTISKLDGVDAGPSGEGCREDEGGRGRS